MNDEAVVPTAIPAEIFELAERRLTARAAKDFATSDVIREEIAAKGWLVKDVVLDGAASFSLTIKPPFEVIDALTAVGSRSDTCVIIKVDGWAEDVLQCVKSLLGHSACDFDILLLDVSGDIEVGLALLELKSDRVQVFHFATDRGWGKVMREACERVDTAFVILVDPSTIAIGDAITPVQEVFMDPTVAGVGWRGALVNLDDDWRSFDDRGPGEVDVLLGYYFAIRRAVLLATGGPHPKARFYRNADMELSLDMRATGARLVAIELPLEQGRHRGYHDSDPVLREQESKKNYDRILAKFRGRSEILSPRR